MSTVTVSFRAPELRHDLEALHGEWGWFAVLVVSLVVLGFVALGSLFVASLATAVAIGRPHRALRGLTLQVEMVAEAEFQPTKRR